MSESAELSTAYFRLLLQSALLPPERLLAGTDCTPETLQQATFLSWEVLAAMFRNIEAAGLPEGWSARLGEQYNLSAHGPLGFAALSAPTLGEAMRVMATYYPVRNTALSAALVDDGATLSLQLVDQTGDAWFARRIEEVIAKIVEVLLATILGHRVSSNVVIHFAHPAPPDPPALLAEYDAAVRFDAPVTCVTIPRAWGDLPCPLRDEQNYRANVARCRELIAARQSSHDPVAMVRSRLAGHFDLVLAGERLDSTPPTLVAMAAELAITPRTLIRRLERGGSAYKTLLEEVRRDYARQLLGDARLTVAQVGEYLGYREPANFGRAFRRWFGQSPAAWRRR